MVTAEIFVPEPLGSISFWLSGSVFFIRVFIRFGSGLCFLLKKSAKILRLSPFYLWCSGTARFVRSYVIYKLWKMQERNAALHSERIWRFSALGFGLFHKKCVKSDREKLLLIKRTRDQNPTFMWTWLIRPVSSNVLSSVVDPWHFGTDPDRGSVQLTYRCLLFNALVWKKILLGTSWFVSICSVPTFGTHLGKKGGSSKNVNDLKLNSSISVLIRK